MPISIRDETTETLADRPVRPPGSSSVAVRDPIRHMEATANHARRVPSRSDPLLSFTDAIAGILNRLPTAVVTQLFGSMLKGVDFVTSNVPGVPVPVFFAGAALESQVAFGPLTGAAANVTLVSYLDDLHIGVNMDRAAIPDRGDASEVSAASTKGARGPDQTGGSTSSSSVVAPQGRPRRAGRRVPEATSGSSTVRHSARKNRCCI